MSGADSTHCPADTALVGVNGDLHGVLQPRRGLPGDGHRIDAVENSVVFEGDLIEIVASRSVGTSAVERAVDNLELDAGQGLPEALVYTEAEGDLLALGYGSMSRWSGSGEDGRVAVGDVVRKDHALAGADLDSTDLDVSSATRRRPLCGRSASAVAPRPPSQ